MRRGIFLKVVWDAKMLRGLPSLPGSVQAIASFDPDPNVRMCDLDDAGRLVELDLRPSQVVTRQRAITQASALRIFQKQRWGGIRWWSYYDPRWGSHCVWDSNALDLRQVNH